VVDHPVQLVLFEKSLSGIAFRQMSNVRNPMYQSAFLTQPKRLAQQLGFSINRGRFFAFPQSLFHIVIDGVFRDVNCPEVSESTSDGLEMSLKLDMPFAASQLVIGRQGIEQIIHRDSLLFRFNKRVADHLPNPLLQ
jgi:hypothetical protein